MTKQVQRDESTGCLLNGFGDTADGYKNMMMIAGELRLPFGSMYTILSSNVHFNNNFKYSAELHPYSLFSRQPNDFTFTVVYMQTYND